MKSGRTTERVTTWKSFSKVEVWEAAFGEALVCEKEPKNASDRYAVAVKKELS